MALVTVNEEEPCLLSIISSSLMLSSPKHSLTSEMKIAIDCARPSLKCYDLAMGFVSESKRIQMREASEDVAVCQKEGADRIGIISLKIFAKKNAEYYGQYSRHLLVRR